MGREKDEMGVTRMVVEIDGRWNPKTVYARIQSTGLPIQGVKPGDCGRCVLSFGEPLTSEALFMIQRDIISFFASSPSGVKNIGRIRQKEPELESRHRHKKDPYIHRRV